MVLTSLTKTQRFSGSRAIPDSPPALNLTSLIGLMDRLLALISGSVSGGFLRQGWAAPHRTRARGLQPGLPSECARQVRETYIFGFLLSSRGVASGLMDGSSLNRWKATGTAVGTLAVVPNLYVFQHRRS